MADALAGLGTSRSEFETIDFDSVEQILLDYGKAFQSMAAGQLRRANKVSTGALSDSIAFTTKRTKNGYELNIEVLDYYKFIDQGVKGTESVNTYTSTRLESKLTRFTFQSQHGQ